MTNKIFKKVMALTLAGVMTLSLAACGGKDTPDNTQGSSGQSTQQEDAAKDSSAASPADSSGQEQAAAPIEDTTIKIRIMNEIRNIDKVMAKYEEMTADDPIMSKIHPEIVWIPGGDYKDKLTTAMIGQEDVDLMFCGSWFGMNSFIQDGNFADLSSYFNNDAFPGLKKAFSSEFVNAMTSYVRQEDGSYTK